MESVLAAMQPDVTWANGMEGGYVHGRDEVRRYWTRQWAMIDPHVEPIGFKSADDDDAAAGAVLVNVHQVVHDLQGKLLADRYLDHVFQIEAGLIKRFDIGEP